jgi:hypothetical protein
LWFIVGVVHCENNVFKTKKSTWVNLEAHMKVNGASAGFFGVQIYFPQLAQGVSLNKVTLIVDMETMIDSVTLEIADKACYVNNCHAMTLPFERATL